LRSTIATEFARGRAGPRPCLPALLGNLGHPATLPGLL